MEVGARQHHYRNLVRSRDGKELAIRIQRNLVDFKLDIRGVEGLCEPVRCVGAPRGTRATARTLGVLSDVPRAAFESPSDAIRISDPTATKRSASLIAIACLRPEGVGLSSIGSRSTKSGRELRDRWSAASPLPAGPETLFGSCSAGWSFRNLSQSSSVLMAR